MRQATIVTIQWKDERERERWRWTREKERERERERERDGDGSQTAQSRYRGLEQEGAANSVWKHTGQALGVGLVSVVKHDDRLPVQRNVGSNAVPGVVPSALINV
jgi:hypothetical protein